MSLCTTTINDGTSRKTYKDAFTFEVPSEGDIRCMLCERKLLEVPFPTEFKVEKKKVCNPRKGLTDYVEVTLCVCLICAKHNTWEP